MVAMATIASLALAGCGGGSSDAGGTASAPSTSASGSSSGSSQSAAFAAKVTNAMKGRPSVWSGPTTPAKAPTGISVAMIVCDKTLPGCALDGATQAAQKLGWKVTAYNGQSNPDVENRAILAAVASGDKAIILGGIDPRLVQNGLKAAKAAGIVVGSTVQGGFSPTPKLKLAPGQVNVDFDVSSDWTLMGESTADAIIADSDSAHVLMITDPEFYSVDLEVAGAKSEFAKCSACKVSTMKISASQLATTVPQDVVGFLNAHQDIKYVYAPYDGIPLSIIPTLRQSGINVKMTGLQGNAPNLALIKAGTIQFADVAFAVDYTGWAAVDQTIRLLDKQPLSQPVGENVPYQLITKANVGAAAKTYTAPFEFENKFLTLWK
jgi:ribose transport system substrate-binding protein